MINIHHWINDIFVSLPRCTALSSLAFLNQQMVIVMQYGKWIARLIEDGYLYVWDGASCCLWVEGSIRILIGLKLKLKYLLCKINDFLFH